MSVAVIPTVLDMMLLCSIESRIEDSEKLSAYTKRFRVCIQIQPTAESSAIS